VSKQFVDENSLVTDPHAVNNPELELSNFWLFGHINTSLANRVFNDADEVLEASIEL
jgi:hypothetical protein